MLVVTTSSHRGDAFAACQFVMDYLKTDAPFWKKETTDAGMRWVDARDSDADARERWKCATQSNAIEYTRSSAVVVPARPINDRRRLI